MNTDFTTQDLQNYITGKKMKMIYTYLPSHYYFDMTQKQLDSLLKLSIPKLEKKLETITNKLTMDILNTL